VTRMSIELFNKRITEQDLCDYNTYVSIRQAPPGEMMQQMTVFFAICIV